MNKYRCKHCKAVVKRDSDKAWVDSWCDIAGKNAHLMRLNNPPFRRTTGERDGQSAS